MKNRYQYVVYLCLCCIGLVAITGCAIQYPGSSYPGQQQSPGSPPTLSNLSVSPNPAAPGTIVNLSVAYVDPDGDLQYGAAAISVNGTALSPVAFRSIYVSGILTIPMPISYYSRPTDVQIILRIRDSSGNWSNSLSTTLAIR